MNGPRAIDFDKQGNLWLVLREGNVVLKLVDGKWQRMAGTGEKGLEDGEARSAKLNGPKGISCAPDGSVYIADTENHAIRRIVGGRIETVARGMKRPHGVFADAAEPGLSSLTASSRTAPLMAGIAIRNENVAVDSRSMPQSNPPEIVQPERDTPGRIATA